MHDSALMKVGQGGHHAAVIERASGACPVNGEVATGVLRKRDS